MFKYQKLLEKMFAIGCLFLYTGAIAPFVSETNAFYSFKEALPNIGLVITLLLMCPRWKRIINILVREKYLWILLAVAILSPFWSDTPILTIESLMPLVRVSIFGVYLATCHTLHDQLKIFTWAFGIASLLSLLFSLFLPSYGVVGRGFVATVEDTIHTGAWRGVYVHKNDLGSAMTFGAITFFLNAIANYKFRRVMWAGFIMTMAVIVASKSSTGLLVVLVVMVLTPFYKALRWHHSKALPFLIMTILIGGSLVLLSISSAEAVLTSLGRDITLTGRTEIWPAVLQKIAQRPWLGYGYETFWLGEWEGETADVWRQLAAEFEPHHAHNGFLDLYLGLGLLGLICFGFSFISNSLRAFLWARQVQGAEGLMPLLYLTPLILINLSESRFMLGGIYWLIYVTVTISMHSTVNKLNIWSFVNKGKLNLIYN